MLALEATGLSDRTVIVFASDHGDMLGERGLWYKMSFFEGSARVPLIVAPAAALGAGRVADNASLVDLLPTFLDLAGGGNIEVVEPLAGSSLLPLVSSGRVPRAARSSASTSPRERTRRAIMLCREGFKYVHCPGDPDLLFDLEADPNELENLAEEPARRRGSVSSRARGARRPRRADRRGAREPAPAAARVPRPRHRDPDRLGLPAAGRFVAPVRPGRRLLGALRPGQAPPRLNDAPGTPVRSSTDGGAGHEADDTDRRARRRRDVRGPGRAGCLRAPGSARPADLGGPTLEHARRRPSSGRRSTPASRPTATHG